jgi:hypothetical protein
LVSLFFYAKSGGEADLYEAARVLNNDFDDVDEAVKWFWNELGRGTLVHTQAPMAEGLATHGCSRLIFEGFQDDFDAQLASWLDAWDVSADVRPALAAKARRHDLSRRSEAAQASDHHVSRSKFSKKNKADVRRALLEIPEAAALIEKQREELGYRRDSA